MTARPSDDLRIADVVTFLAVHRHGSLIGASLDLRVTPSQVSKAVARLERRLKRTLLVRTGRGVALDEAAADLVPRFEDLVERAHMLEGDPKQRASTLKLAAASYLCASYMPAMVRAVPSFHFRGVEVAPAFIRAFANERVFDIALTVGEERLSSAWVSTRVGNVAKSLFGSPRIAKRLGRRPSVARLREVAFVCSVNDKNGRWLPGDDSCPLARSERIVGHEASTFGVALELAAASDQLVFGPTIAARTAVAAGRVVEIDVPEWRVVDSLFFHANADRVLARVQRSIVAALRATIA